MPDIGTTKIVDDGSPHGGGADAASENIATATDRKAWREAYTFMGFPQVKELDVASIPAASALQLYYLANHWLGEKFGAVTKHVDGSAWLSRLIQGGSSGEPEALLFAFRHESDAAQFEAVFCVPLPQDKSPAAVSALSCESSPEGLRARMPMHEALWLRMGYKPEEVGKLLQPLQAFLAGMEEERSSV